MTGSILLDIAIVGWAINLLLLIRDISRDSKVESFSWSKIYGEWQINPLPMTSIVPFIMVFIYAINHGTHSPENRKQVSTVFQVILALVAVAVLGVSIHNNFF